MKSNLLICLLDSKTTKKGGRYRPILSNYNLHYIKCDDGVRRWLSVHRFKNYKEIYHV